jgi:hypothetical protein
VPHQRGVDAHDAGRADALENARANQPAEAIRQRAAERSDREQREAGDVDPAITEAFAKRRERQQQDSDRQLIGVDDPDRRRGRRPDFLADRRQRDVGDCAVEHRHGQREPDRSCRPIPPRRGQAGFFNIGRLLLEIHSGPIERARRAVPTAIGRGRRMTVR